MLPHIGSCGRYGINGIRANATDNAGCFVHKKPRLLGSERAATSENVNIVQFVYITEAKAHPALVVHEHEHRRYLQSFGLSVIVVK